MNQQRVGTRFAMTSNQIGLTLAILRGMIVGVARIAVMTAFQKLVKLPLTVRSDSFAPTDFADVFL
jgi:hypothetical protein